VDLRLLDLTGDGQKEMRIASGKLILDLEATEFDLNQ
jgi:hypothetical protein